MRIHYHRHFRCGAIILFCCLLPLVACAAKGKHPSFPLVGHHGQLPDAGRVVIRSGLSWLNEEVPIFRSLSAALASPLEARGLHIVTATPSTLESKPKTPLPSNARTVVTPKKTPLLSSKHDDAVTQAKAAQLAREGKLPQVTLRQYSLAEKDADLPENVMAITPPDVGKALFALSQERGMPVLRGTTSIPGRLPAEIHTQDPQHADYVIVARFAHIQPLPLGGGGGGSLGNSGAPSARGLGSVGALGFGQAAAPSAPGTNYGTPGGFIRGYEGSSPSDPWGRDRDFYNRDYTTRNGPQPQWATPPETTASGNYAGAAPPISYDMDTTVAWEVLILECYDLSPARTGKAPRKIWQAHVQQPAGKTGLAADLPAMAQAALEAGKEE